MPLITKLQPHPANSSSPLAERGYNIPVFPSILLNREDISSFGEPYFWEKSLESQPQQDWRTWVRDSGYGNKDSYS